MRGRIDASRLRAWSRDAIRSFGAGGISAILRGIYHYFPTEVSGGSHYQLFNLKNDPFEQKDLAATEPGELKRLMQGMVAALEKQHAVYPVEKDGRTRVKPRVP